MSVLLQTSIPEVFLLQRPYHLTLSFLHRPNNRRRLAGYVLQRCVSVCWFVYKNVYNFQTMLVLATLRDNRYNRRRAFTLDVLCDHDIKTRQVRCDGARSEVCCVCQHLLYLFPGGRGCSSSVTWSESRDQRHVVCQSVEHLLFDEVTSVGVNRKSVDVVSPEVTSYGDAAEFDQ